MDVQQAEGIGFQIKLIHDGINRLFRQEMGMEVPTRSQMRVLQYLTDHAGEKILVKDIMAYLHIDQSTASGIIKRMEKNGYIVCSRDAGDRRQKCIALDPKSRPLSPEIIQQGPGKVEETLLKGLSRQERQELRRMLNVIYENLRDKEGGKR